MTDSPQVRPRQHILEDRSEAHFTLQTPEGWVARPVPKDYGIDYEVEVFEEGRRTGLTFKVQLKATDSDTASLSLKVSDLDYWQQLDVPVLLVLYRASTDEVFSRWAHAHNPWPPIHEDQKTTTVHFTEPYTEHVQRIPSELDLIRRVRSRAIHLPVTIGIEHTDPSMSRGLRHAMRRAIDRYGLRSVVKMVFADPYVTVSFAEEATVIAAPANVSSMTAHGLELTSLDELPTTASNVLALVSLLLTQVGSYRAAADVLLSALPEVTVEVMQSFAPGFTGVLAQDGRWRDLLDLVDGLTTDPETSEDIFLVALLSAPSMPHEIAQALIGHGRSSAADLLARDLPALAAERRFACAQVGVAHDMWSDVNEDLGAAHDLLAEFYDTDQLYQELRGKAHWNLEAFDEALVDYEQAWHLGWQSDQAVAAYGEALIVGGKYERAHQHFEEVVATDVDLMTRWATLLHCVVTDVIRITGLSEQQRRPYNEDEDLTELNESEDPDQLMEALRTRDAINPGLLALHQQAAGEVSLGPLVWTAVHANDIGRWFIAIAAAPRSGANERVARAIVEAAALEFPDVIDELAKFATLLDDPGPHDHGFVDSDYLEWAREVADSAEPYEGPPSLTWHDHRGVGRARILALHDPHLPGGTDPV